MERLELVTVILLAIGAFLIANPAFLGTTQGPGTVAVNTTPVDASVSGVTEAVATTEAAALNPNVTGFQEITGDERGLIREVLANGGQMRLTRDRFNETFQGVRRLDYLRPNGYLALGATLLRPRLSRAQDGGLALGVTPIPMVVGNGSRFDPPTAAAATTARQRPVTLDQRNRTLAVYDYVVLDGDLFAVSVSNASDRTAADANASSGGSTGGNGSAAANGTSALAVTLDPSDPGAVYDRLAVPLEELPPTTRRPVERAIDRGVYDTGNQSVPGLGSIPYVAAESGVYQLGQERRSQNLLEMMEPHNIVGVLLGLIFVVSGLYYGLEVYRRRTAEWE